MDKNKNVLLFYPVLDGHRQVYAQYLIESLLKRNAQVFLVTKSSEAKKSYPYITGYQTHPRVKMIGIPEDGKISLLDFRKLQDRLEADWTVFAEADDELKLFNHQFLPGFPRLRGKNIGVFIRTSNYIHTPKPALTLINVFRELKHFSKGWHSNPFIFHEFTLPKYKLIHTALMLDEFFVESHAKFHQWLPEIVFPLSADDESIDAAETLRWEPLLASFLEKNKGLETIFYFGEAQQRRGYDTLLKLARDEKCCFIHCGRSSYPEKYGEDIETLKMDLDSQGRLFETKTFIQSYQGMALFFMACKYIVLPYRDHLGSSGVMMQAIHFGKPVLVPDQGLMASRTQKHHLGLIYDPADGQNLKKQWAFLKETTNDFSNDLARYKLSFAPLKVFETLAAVFERLEE
jgi:glycosyltransferase involved in cell wall biosynthesis